MKFIRSISGAAIGWTGVDMFTAPFSGSIS